MILGVDHIALSVADLDKEKNSLESREFMCVFLEKNIPNNPVKRPLLKHYQQTHDIALLRSKVKGTSIEIINHGNVADSIAPFSYHDGYIELCTPDLQLEKLFWKTVFSFQESSSESLTYRSLVPHWSCTLRLIEKPKLQWSNLDDSGFSCLAFLSNDIEKDARIAKIAGSHEMTPQFRLDPNGRNIDVIMFRSPGGAICELIQVTI